MARRLKPVGVTPLALALREARKVGIALVLFSLFLNLLLLVSPIYMMQVFDRVLTSGRGETLLFLTIIAIAAMAVLGALEAARARLLSRVGIWLERRLAPEVITSSLRARLMGEPMTAQTLRDLDQLKGFCSGAGVTALCDAPWAPIFLVVLLGLHPWLGVLGFVGAVLLLGLAVLNEYVSRAPLKDEARTVVGDREAVDQALKNAEVLHAMGMLPGFLNRWREQSTITLAAQLDAGERSGLMVGLSKFVRMAVQIFILGLGALLVLKGELTAGGMIAASIILGRALAPVDQSIGAWKSFVGARQAYERLRMLFLATQPKHQAMRLPSPRGRLQCEQLVFLPPMAKEPVIKGIEFALEPGTTLGIIGPSAAGKSTLCRLLVGVWQPTRGHVRLDGADLANYNADDLGTAIGYLPQDVELFAGTVKDNIARLRPDPDSRQIVEASVLAGVHEMILALPQGYDTDIGPGGSFLSGGQRQRLGLARALYGRPRLIVLDEPNANLDSEGEAALMRAILAAKHWGATVIIVAHQPGILRPADKLLLLVQGQVRFFGPRDQLMGRLNTVSAGGVRPADVAPPARPEAPRAVGTTRAEARP